MLNTHRCRPRGEWRYLCYFVTEDNATEFFERFGLARGKVNTWYVERQGHWSAYSPEEFARLFEFQE